MEKRLLFLDLDGTLLNDQKEITALNRQALEQALERGHGVVIATGRPLKSAKDLAGRLGLDKPGCMMIASNGALLYDWEKNDTIYSCTMPISTVRKLFAEANRRNLHIQTYEGERVLVEPRCVGKELEWYCERIGMAHKVIADAATDVVQEPVKCLMIALDDQADLRAMQQWIGESLAQEADCFFSCKEYLEIVVKGMNKGNAVRRLCGLMGVDIANAVAVGDAANDLSMIRAAGIGVAMANGTEDVKAAADYITRNDNNHDGIAEVVEKFLHEKAE